MIKESDIQTQLVTLLDLVLPSDSIRHHSPNEGMHRPQYRAKQARMGMTSGWPDLEIMVPDVFFRCGVEPATIFIELKTPTGRVSDKQRLVMAKLEALGCHVAVCRSVQESVKFLAELLDVDLPA